MLRCGMSHRHLLALVILVGCGNSSDRSPNQGEPARFPSQRDGPEVPMVATPGVQPTNDLVDGTLPAANYSVVLGEDSEGRVLLKMHGSSTGTPVAATGLDDYHYLAVLGANHSCIEETHTYDRFHAANWTGRIEEALEILQAEETAAEIERVAALGQRFGRSHIWKMAFPLEDDVRFVEANNQLYELRDGRWQHLEGGPSSLIGLSHDGAWLAYKQCRGGCQGLYTLSLRNVESGESRHYRTGGVRDAFWAPSGVVYFVYHNAPSFRVDATRGCVGSLEPGNRRPRTLHCARLSAPSVAGTASPNRQFLSLEVPAERGAWTFHVLSLPSGDVQRTFTTDGLSAGAVYLDGAARVLFTDRGYHSNPDRARLITAAAETERVRAQAAGFLKDGRILLQRRRPEQDAEEAQHLAAQRCGNYEVWDGL